MIEKAEWKFKPFLECWTGLPIKDAQTEFKYIKPKQVSLPDSSYSLVMEGSISILDYNKMAKLEREGVQVRTIPYKNLPRRCVRRTMLGISYRPIDYCCGAGLAFDARLNYQILPKHADNLVDLYVKHYSLVIRAAEIWAKHYCNRHHLLYYTADGQEQLESALEKRGFTVIDEFHNANSGNDVRLWTKALTKDYYDD